VVAQRFYSVFYTFLQIRSDGFPAEHFVTVDRYGMRYLHCSELRCPEHEEAYEEFDGPSEGA
jgi:hypothetical protein